LVDASGIQPTFIGELPPQLTALMRTNINVQELTVQALMTENREHIYHAAMMDPHTAAELDLDQIWSLVDDLLAHGHGDWLPEWADANSLPVTASRSPAALSRDFSMKTVHPPVGRSARRRCLPYCVRGYGRNMLLLE
jgi:hypothetical protein